MSTPTAFRSVLLPQATDLVSFLGLDPEPMSDEDILTVASMVLIQELARTLHPEDHMAHVHGDFMDEAVAEVVEVYGSFVDD